MVAMYRLSCKLQSLAARSDLSENTEVVPMKPILAALAALLLLAACQSKDAIDITWKDHAQTRSLADEAGHYVLVHFWASWCPPCREEMPEITAWAKEHPGIVFLPISLDDKAADAASFLKAQKLHLPVLMGSVDQAQNLGVRGLPTTIIIDPKGKVVRSMLGERPWGADAFSQSILKSMHE
jgi:thiol-disulfide isomerase/thioredoxin